MERSVHDALCVVKRVLESNQVVPGGGAVEAALSIYLETFATSIVSAPIMSLWACLKLTKRLVIALYISGQNCFSNFRIRVWSCVW